MARPRHGLAVAAALAAPLLVLGCGGGGGLATRLIAPSAQVRAAAADPLTVSPLPGTPDAMPATQISFLGGAGTRVRDVRVAGSLTGLHAGVLSAYATGTGESFLPARAFAAGERVTVTARVAAGHGRGRLARSWFTVARPVPITRKSFPPDSGDPAAVQHYSSAPTLTPSTVRITTPAQPGASPGDLFLAPYQGPGAPGPMITDQRGNLVWFHPLPAGEAATNFSVIDYGGAPALSWWQGRILELGYGEGEDVVYDSSYREIARVRAGNGLSADLHVVRFTPGGTAWVDAYEPIRVNLGSGKAGSSATVLSDSVVQEIDVRTGLVMWEWHALGHIPVAESRNPLPSGSYPWDFAHVNSIDPGPHGDVLLSFRNTWSIDDVDIHSGGFHWRIGGLGTTEHLAAGATFYWQHDAEFRRDGEISLFDNASTPPEERESRGIVLAPNLRTHRVRIVRQFVNPARTLLAESQGNMQALARGNWLLGYGRLPDFTEFDARGRVLLDGTLGPGVQSFAATLAPWQGHPSTRPAILATRAPGGALTVAASWNGATGVAAWQLLAGASPGALRPVAQQRDSGFQTTLTTAAAARWVAVRALSASGSALATSLPVRA